MSLPVNAQVGAVPNFARNLDEARAFFVLQDEESASLRFAKLKAELWEMSAMLVWSPACGRPARFLNAKSAQGRFRVEAILKMAKQVGHPYLHEYVVGKHIVLYAHSESVVTLFALKHQRQLTYNAVH